MLSLDNWVVIKIYLCLESKSLSAAVSGSLDSESSGGRMITGSLQNIKGFSRFLRCLALLKELFKAVYLDNMTFFLYTFASLLYHVCCHNHLQGLVIGGGLVMVQFLGTLGLLGSKSLKLPIPPTP